MASHPVHTWGVCVAVAEGGKVGFSERKSTKMRGRVLSGGKQRCRD